MCLGHLQGRFGVKGLGLGCGSSTCALVICRAAVQLLASVVPTLGHGLGHGFICVILVQLRGNRNRFKCFTMIVLVTVCEATEIDSGVITIMSSVWSACVAGMEASLGRNMSKVLNLNASLGRNISEVLNLKP